MLIDELKVIRDNANGELTHGEIRSFFKAFIAAEDSGTIDPFCDLHIELQDKVMFYINLIRAYGINHRCRSAMADKCLQFIEPIAEAMPTPKSSYPIDTEFKTVVIEGANSVGEPAPAPAHDSGWDTIPF